MDSTPAFSWRPRRRNTPNTRMRRSTLARLLAGGDLIAVAPQVLAEFIHIVTDSRRFTHPLDMTAARRLAEQWWTASNVVPVFPDDGATRQFLAGWRNSPWAASLLDTLLAATYRQAGVQSLSQRTRPTSECSACLRALRRRARVQPCDDGIDPLAAPAETQTRLHDRPPERTPTASPDPQVAWEAMANANFAALATPAASGSPRTAGDKQRRRRWQRRRKEDPQHGVPAPWAPASLGGLAGEAQVLATAIALPADPPPAKPSRRANAGGRFCRKRSIRAAAPTGFFVGGLTSLRPEAAAPASAAAPVPRLGGWNASIGSGGVNRVFGGSRTTSRSNGHATSSRLLTISWSSGSPPGVRLVTRSAACRRARRWCFLYWYSISRACTSPRRKSRSSVGRVLHHRPRRDTRC